MIEYLTINAKNIVVRQERKFTRIISYILELDNSLSLIIDATTIDKQPLNYDIGLIYGLELISSLKLSIGKAVYINNVETVSKCQNQGYGGRLIKEVLKLLKLSNLSDVYLFVNEDNSVAINLYLKNGFIQKGLSKDGYIEMRCSL